MIDVVIERAVNAPIELVVPRNDAEIRAAIKLGDPYRDTLGFLPAPVYFDAAARKNLVVARYGDRVVGYALFGRSRRAGRFRPPRGFRYVTASDPLVVHRLVA